MIATSDRVLHEHGVKGHVTINVLIFDTELEVPRKDGQASRALGVDALIVQDIGAARHKYCNLLYFTFITCEMFYVLFSRYSEEGEEAVVNLWRCCCSCL